MVEQCQQNRLFNMFPKEILAYCIGLSNIKELIYGTLFMIKSVIVVEFPFTKSV